MSAYEELMAVWSVKGAESRDASAARRDRVLAHPDLVARMKKAPLRMAEPERWTGWIPPRTDPQEACSGCRRYEACTTTQHRARINDSPYRRELVEIAAEALRRETAAEEPDPAEPEIDEPPDALEA